MSKQTFFSWNLACVRMDNKCLPITTAVLLAAHKVWHFLGTFASRTLSTCLSAKHFDFADRLVDLSSNTRCLLYQSARHTFIRTEREQEMCDLYEVTTDVCTWLALG